MEIRAKISLAVDNFKQNAKIVSSTYGQVAKRAKAADDYISKSAKTGATSRRAFSEQSANGQMAAIRKVEKAAIESNKRVQASYNSIKPNKLPLPLVQQSVRSTFTATSNTQGLPKVKTVDDIAAQRKAIQDKINADTAYYQKLSQMAAAARASRLNENQKEYAAYRKIIDDKIKADTDYYARRSAAAQKAAAETRTLEAKIAAESAKINKEAKIGAALNDPSFERNLASIRYALYDIGGRAFAFSGAIVSAIGQAVKAFADLESSFTSVERVTLGLSQGALMDLRQSLIDISTSSPIAFDEIAKIATLGGQMGISADALAGFSKTVAQFSAITGISADQAAQSFGRLAQMMDVPVSKFENLASSILYAGVNSVATDREILAMAESIGSAASQAGMAADQVIGLSTALASLKVRPEEARGVILRLFRTIDVEVSNGGSKLNDYASVLGLVSDAASTAGEKAGQLWKQDPNKFFASFLQGASAAGDLNVVMQQLGITNTRELNVITKLAGNIPLLTKSMADARKEYLLGEYSSKAFNVANDDLNSKIKMLSSTVDEFSAKFGETLAPAVKLTLDILKNVAKVVTFIPGPIKAIIAVVGLFTAGVLAVGGALAVGIAGMLAFKLAFDRMDTSITGVGINFTTFKILFREMVGDLGIGTAVANGFSNSLVKIGFSADAAAVATNKMGAAASFLQSKMGIIGAVLLVGTAIWTMAEASNAASIEAAKLGDAMIQAGGGSEAFAAAITADTVAYNDTKQSLGELSLEYDKNAKSAAKAEGSRLAIAEGAAAWVEGTKNAVVENGNLTNATETQIAANDKYNESLKNTNSALKGVTAQMGSNTAAFMIDSLAKYKGTDGNQATFFENYLKSGNKSLKATAEAFGFNIGEMTTAGIKKSGGAQKYIEQLKKDITGASSAIQNRALGTSAAQALKEYGKSVGWTEEKVASLQKRLSTDPKKAAYFTGLDQYSLYNLDQFFTDAALGIDSMTGAAAQNKIIVDAQIQAMVDMGYTTTQAEQAVGGLSEALTGYLTSSTSVETANNAAIDSFATYVQGIQDTSDGLAGSRQDFANWSSFMQSAVDAAIAAGQGFPGSVQRMITAIVALKNAGKDTKKPFADMKQYMINAANGEGFTGLADKIKKATGPEQLKGLIQSWINVQDASTKAGKAAIAYGIALQGALTTDPALLNTLTDAFNNVDNSATTAKTALEKLQEQITKTFAAFNAKLNLSQSLSDLGQKLKENGSVFNTWSQAGRDNSQALLTVIDNMAVKSKGNLKDFGTNLKSLRQALINTGNGSPQALALIDKELKKIGNSGKVSKAEVKSLAASLKALGDTKTSVEVLADRINNLASAVMNYLNARWQMANTQLEIAAGWEAIANKAKDAADAITEAKNKLMEINANKAVLQAQLEVAIRYGDTLRADQLRAEIAKLEQDAADAQKKANGGGTASDLLEQQKALQGMVQYYVQMGAADVVNAKSKEEAKAAVDATVKSFEDQARAAGVSEENIKTYSDELRKGLEMAKKINEPAKYKVDAQTAQALKDIYAFRDKATEAINKIPKTVTVTVKTKTAKAEGGLALATGGIVSGAGGPTSDSIPAMLSNGEYVVKAAAVNTYGVDFMNSINNMKVSAPSIGGQIAAAVGGSGGMVYLSPEDRALLRAAIDRPVNLYADNTKIAQSANAGNIVLAKRGAR